MTRKNILLLCLLLLSFVAAYLPVWKGLISVWSTSDEYSHGFLIVPLCLFITWRKKEDLVSVPTGPSGWGLAIVILSLLLYILSRLAEIVTFVSLSMVLVLAGAIVYLYGFRMLKQLLFPLFLLLFMIPVPGQIYASLTVPLQLLVSKSGVWAASLLDIPVYREGNVIHLPGRTLAVVEACSGLRSLISLLTLGAVFGYFSLRSNLLRGFLFISAIPASILVNVFRVLLLIVAFYYFDYDLTAGTAHTVLGLLVFILAMAFIFGMHKILSRWDQAKEKAV